jgi:hypothetical protein
MPDVIKKSIYNLISWIRVWDCITNNIPIKDKQINKHTKKQNQKQWEKRKKQTKAKQKQDKNETKP